jgi:hypothetical protein
MSIVESTTKGPTVAFTLKGSNCKNEIFGLIIYVYSGNALALMIIRCTNLRSVEYKSEFFGLMFQVKDLFLSS